MTEYEMASLLTDMMDSLAAAATFNFAVLTTFLIASFAAAHRLTRTMSAVVLGLFLLASISLIAAMYGQLAALAGLVERMREYAHEGAGLSWHIATTVPSWTMEFARYLGPITFLAGTFAAIYFFFHCRSSHRAIA